MQLSKNFNLREFTKSNTATRRGIDNDPNAEQIHNLSDLCENILQPLRNEIDASIRVTSGFRSEKLNEAIGGSKSSDHSFGRASDLKLVINGQEDTAKLFYTIKRLDLPFYQMIWEFGDSDQPDWIHIAFRKDNIKKECLKAYKEDGRTKYVVI